MHRQGTVALLAGVVGAARTHAVIRNTGDLSGCRGDLATPPSGDGPRQASEGLIRPENPGNAGGGKEPWFGVRLDEPR
jgi:hypothetical protein